MFIRRHEAVFLVFVAVLTAPFFIPHFSSAVLKESDKMCAPFDKDCPCNQVMDPQTKKCKPGTKKNAQGYSNVNKCPKGVCVDTTSGKKTLGTCPKENECKAEETDGKTPKTCVETGECKPGETKPGEQPKPGGEPKMPELPKPPGGGGEGGGGQPKPNDAEKKQEEIPRPNEEPKPDGALIRSEGVPVPDKQEEKTEEAKDHTDPFATEADMKDRADLPAQAAGDKSNVTDMHEQSQVDATGFNDGRTGSREVREGDEVKEQTFAERAVETANDLRETAAKAYDGAKEAIANAANEAKETFSRGVENLREAFGFGGEKPLETGTGQYDVQQSENTEAEYLVNNPKETSVTMSEGFYPARVDGVTEASVEPLVEEVDQVEVAKDYAADALENTPLELAKDAAASPLDTLHTYNENDIEQLTPEPEQSFSAHVEEIWTDAPEQTVAERIAETATVAYEAVTETVQTTAQRITNFFRRLF